MMCCGNRGYITQLVVVDRCYRQQEIKGVYFNNLTLRFSLYFYTLKVIQQMSNTGLSSLLIEVFYIL